MKKSEIKTLIKEEAEVWIEKDIIDTAEALVLAKKSLIGAIRNFQKLEVQMAKHKNKPQGDILYSMLPVMKLSGQLSGLNKLDKGMGRVFSKSWAMLKKNE